MKMSQTFIKTLREAPKDETAKNGQLLIRAGYVAKELAGVYNYLPLGLRVLENIKQIVREELNAIGAEEMFMSSLQNPDLWKATDRWDDKKMDIWFKTELNAGGELGLAPTHEEPITNIMKTFIKSYKDLPVVAYQFQTKFRNELRAKSGILRGREFIMKDMYSFHETEADLDAFYEKAEAAYARIYTRLGLGDCTHETFASGGVFSKYSHEYQTLLPVGEDTVYYNSDRTLFLNEEVFNDEVLAEFGESRENFQSTAAAEVGNIFKLKFKYSEPLGLNFQDADNNQKTVYMGCYGIGITRAMGVITEKYADEKGLIWPAAVAPYQYYIIGIGPEGESKAAELYAGRENLAILDDRNARPGEKFADADLLGIPTRIVVSAKTLATSSAEVTDRATGETRLVPLTDLF